eukprot:753731-Pleurochrysis_carterae.AAC.1
MEPALDVPVNELAGTGVSPPGPAGRGADSGGPGPRPTGRSRAGSRRAEGGRRAAPRRVRCRPHPPFRTLAAPPADRKA